MQSRSRDRLGGDQALGFTAAVAQRLVDLGQAQMPDGTRYKSLAKVGLWV
jgi:hypothetical protein